MKSVEPGSPQPTGTVPTGCFLLPWTEVSAQHLAASRRKFLKIPALSALSALVKAEREDDQLWEAVHFLEIIRALLLHFLHCFEGIHAPNPFGFVQDQTRLGVDAACPVPECGVTLFGSLQKVF